MKALGVCLLALTACTASKLLISEDNTVTWKPHESVVPHAISDVSVKLSEPHSPQLQLPACALQDSLQVIVWRDGKGKKAVGLNWFSKQCHPNVDVRNGISVKDKIIPRIKPDWITYVRSNQDYAKEKVESKPTKKGFFGKYGIYIMLFVCIALGQGIRQGIAELRAEVAREEQLALEKKTKKASGQLRVVVPKRKEAKGKKKTAAAASKR